MSLNPSTLTSAPLPDVCRNRHGGNDESELANLKVHSRKEIDCERIMVYADFMDSYGITFKEVVKALGLLPQTASARLADLKKAVRLVRKGDLRRDGCGVFIRAKGQLKLL